MQTADGVPYWKIALLHLDSIASTVVQKCIYWGTHEQCGFCGIELTRGEQTVPVKTPAMLAEVCTAARDHDGAVDVTLTTGSLNRRDRGALYISQCATAIKEACGLPVQVQFEPPDDLSVLDEVHAAGVDAVGMHLETFDPEVLARVAPGKAQTGIDGYFRAWERAVEVFGRGRVTTYVILGMGEDRALIEEGCRRAIEMGVYPFVVPLRPVPGTLMADADAARARLRRLDLPRRCRRCWPTPGFDHADAGAGCARCQACSGLSAWERVFAKERWRELAEPSAPPEGRDRRVVRLCRSARQRAAHFAVRRAVFVDEQEMFAGDDRDERDARITTLHAIGIAGGASAGAVRLYPLRGGDWKGDRLAVLPEARHGALGARLVRFAVATAGARGGARMVAMIQLPNVAFFEPLGWQRDGRTVAFHGRPHQPMAIALTPHA